MAQKNELKNKAVKPKTTKKEVVKVKTISWDSMPAKVEILGVNSKHLVKGTKYKVTKETAKLLVEKGAAELCQ